MRSVWAWLGLSVAVAVACGNGADDHPGSAPAGGGTSNTNGGKQSHAGSSSANAGDGVGAGSAEGGAGSGVEGGAGNLGGADAEAGATMYFESAGAPPTFPPGVCAPDMSLGTEQAQSVGADNATLLAMTPDELSIAFTTGSADTLSLHVADRASAQAAFAEVGVTLPDDYEAASGATFTADGLALVLVSKDHGSLGSLTRSKRGDAFESDVDTTAFAKLNLLKPMSGESIGWPLLSKDGKTLYYVSYSTSALVTQCIRDKDGVFDFGTPIDEFTLGGAKNKFKLLSGISADERAIFFFDQDTKHAAALFRSRDGAPFYDPVDLGDRHGVVPNGDCTRVYSSNMSGVVVQPVQ